MFIMSNLSEHVQKFFLVTLSLLRKSCVALKFSRENVYIEKPFKAMEMAVYHSHALTLTDSSVPWSLCSLSPQWDGEQKDKVKQRKCWKKSSLIGKAKASHADEANEGVHSSLLMGRQVPALPRKAGPNHSLWWLQKTNVITLNIPPFPSFTTLYAEHDTL